jgi:hypothetical protein
MSMRVDATGRKLLDANPQIGMKPLFATIGDPKPEIFHLSQQGTNTVYVTAGLVNMCQSEAQLAAILGHELGKMVSEREARTSAAVRAAAGLPPPEMVVGQAGGYAAADMTHMAELARYEKRNPRRPLSPPDPRYLAQNYLEKAGFARSELDRAIPLLDEADKNMAWERQITGGARHGSWTP